MDEEEVLLAQIEAEFALVCFGRGSHHLYFGACSRYLLPKSSAAVGAAQLRKQTEAPWTVKYSTYREEARTRAAKLLDADARHVLFFACTSHAASAAARLFAGASKDVQESSCCLVIRDDVEMIAVPAARSFGRLVVADSPHDVPALLESREDIVAAFLTHAFWTTGVLVPNLENVIRICAAKNVALLLDVTQSLGVITYSMKQLFGAYPRLRVVVVASVHKHLMSAYGLALAWFSPMTLQNQDVSLATDHHCKGLAIADSWTEFGGGMGPGNAGFQVPHMDNAFESGTSNAVGFAVLSESLRIRLQWPDAIVQKQLRRLIGRAKAIFRECGFSVVHEDDTHAPHFFAAHHENAARIVACLEQEHKVHLQIRHGGIRFSVGMFNNLDQVELMGRCLQDVCKKE